MVPARKEESTILVKSALVLGFEHVLTIGSRDYVLALAKQSLFCLLFFAEYLIKRRDSLSGLLSSLAQETY